MPVGGYGDTTPDELALKAAYWTSPTVNAKLAHTFPAAELGAAALLLAGLAPDPSCPSDADEAACRLMLDALRVSEGDMVKLRMWIEVARVDPRDLIAAAEYPLELTTGDESARSADLSDYLDWIARST
jgi:hypothetical protein